MLLWLLWGVAFARPLPDVLPGDVRAERELAAPAEAIQAEVADLARARLLFPPECTSDWEFAPITAGVGGAAELTWHAGAMHRRLVARIERVEVPWLVTWQHDGKLGFEVMWRLDALESGGTKVTLSTAMDPPPWPVRRHWTFRVHPEWTACYEGTLDRLQSLVDGPTGG
jgi:hypothetical protein